MDAIAIVKQPMSVGPAVAVVFVVSFVTVGARVREWNMVIYVFEFCANIMSVCVCGCTNLWLLLWRWLLLIWHAQMLQNILHLTFAGRLGANRGIAQYAIVQCHLRFVSLFACRIFT